MADVRQNEMEPAAEDPGTGEVNGLFLKEVAKFDCALFDPSYGVIGQSWHVDVDLAGDLDHRGVVYDFGDLKELINQTLKTTLDHTLIIPIGSQSVHYTETPEGERWQLHAKARMSQTDYKWEYICPKGAVFPVRSVALRPQVIEQEFTKLLRHRLPASIHGLNIKLREEAIEPTAAFYRYTHGISNDGGLCQRLFHGHRNRVEVYLGAERRPDHEQFIARELLGSNVHVATPAQVKSGNFTVGRRGAPDQTMVLTNHGNLGTFEATLPADRVFIVEMESTVECVARQLLKVLREREMSREKLRVICYEGINKGAIVSG